MQNLVLLGLFVTTENQRPIKSKFFDQQDHCLKQTGRKNIFQIKFLNKSIDHTLSLLAVKQLGGGPFVD